MSVLKKGKTKNNAENTSAAMLKFRMAPTSEEEFCKLADELIQWAQQPSSLTINGFPLSILMSPELFHKLPADSEYFGQAYDTALQTIGARREKGAREGIFDKQIVLQTMPLYDPSYRKWLMSLRDKTENKGETKIVVVEIPTFKSCDEVPPYKKIE